MGKSEKAEHRQRLRSRFLDGEESAYGDERLLELLLTFTIGRQDTLPISRALIDRFGSLQNVLSAAPEALIDIKGIGEASAAILKVVHYFSPETPDQERETTAKTGSGPEQQMLFEDSIATELLDVPELGRLKPPPKLARLLGLSSMHPRSTNLSNPQRPVVWRKRGVDFAFELGPSGIL